MHVTQNNKMDNTTSTWRVTRKTTEWIAKCGEVTVRGEDEAALRSALRAHCIGVAAKASGASSDGFKATLKRDWIVKVVSTTDDDSEPDIGFSLFD